MANKRELKKAIHQVTGSLFTDCLLIKTFGPSGNEKELDMILDEILDFQDEFLRRVCVYDGKENPTIVKNYFRKLNANIIEKAQQLFAKINAFNL